MTTLKKYHGVVIPSITPLTADHRLDTEAVSRIFEFFHTNHVHPFILGTTGEASSLPISVKKEFLRLAGELKQGTDVLYAGISSNVLDESIELGKYAFDQGVDVVVATLPSYYTLTDAGMLKYFLQLAKNLAGPLMIYNIPATTHMSIPLAVADQLSHHPHIVGLKDSERSEERLKMSVELWKDRSDFSHFLGWAAKSADAILSGSDGLVPSTGNIQPLLYADLFQAAIKKDRDNAYQLQNLSDEWGSLYQSGRTLGESLWALKILLKEYGLCEEYVMPPVYEQSAEEKMKLIDGLNNLLNQWENYQDERKANPSYNNG